MGPNYSSPEIGPDTDPPALPEQDVCITQAGLTTSPPENLMSPRRLSEAAVTSCGAMRTPMAYVSEDNQDALSALKRAEKMYRQTDPSSLKPRDPDAQERVQDTLTQTEQPDVGDRTIRPSRTPTASASIVLAPRQALAHNGGEQMSSMWDPDDEEFDRWPGRETLDRIAANLSTNRGALARSKAPMFDADTMGAPAQESADADTDDGEYSEAESALSDGTRDVILELQDMERGNPSKDKHDEIMQRFYSDICRVFPPSLPPRFMHLIDVDAYMNSRDPIVRYANPRLCDAVATVLFKTNPRCLEDFLNTDIQVFEWRRSPNRVMIHRDGFNVTVGTYHNFGTQYVWSYFVRSSISGNGTWSEVYAALTQGTTPVTKEGVLVEEYVPECAHPEFPPDDKKVALYTSRELAYFLIEREVWDYRRWMRCTVEWETDGVTTCANDIDPNQVDNRMDEWSD